MDERQILAQLLMRGQGQGMGNGNPTADYLDHQSTLQAISAPGKAALAVPLTAGAIGSLMAGNPLMAAMFGTGALGVGGDAALDYKYSQQNDAGSKMWANRFGSGEPSQGLPGTPAGPAWRR